MPSRFLSRLRLRWLPLLCMALLIIGLPVGCNVLQHKERELVFRIEPGTASWYSGLPKAVQEFELKPASFKAGQNIHGWWYPADKKDAPAILLVMGLGGQLTLWPDEFVDALVAHGFRVVRYDNRDVGLSTRFDAAGVPNLKWMFVKAALKLPVRSAYTLADMAADGMALLDHLGIVKVKRVVERAIHGIAILGMHEFKESRMRRMEYVLGLLENAERFGRPDHALRGNIGLPTAHFRDGLRGHQAGTLVHQIRVEFV